MTIQQHIIETATAFCETWQTAETNSQQDNLSSFWLEFLDAHKLPMISAVELLARAQEEAAPRPNTYGIYVDGKGYFAQQGDQQWWQPRIAGWGEFVSEADAAQVARMHCFFELYEIHAQEAL